MIVFIIGVLSLACTIAYANYDDAKYYKYLSDSLSKDNIELDIENNRLRNELYLEQQANEELEELKAKTDQGKITLTVDARQVTEKIMKEVNKKIEEMKKDGR